MSKIFGGMSVGMCGKLPKYTTINIQRRFEMFD